MTGVLLLLLKETTLSMFGKIAWKIIFERFYTRLIITGLNKLKSMSTNDISTDTINDIIDSLHGKKLRVVEDVLSNK